MEIIWSPQAEKSYSDAIDYSIEHFGRFSTIDLTRKVDNAIDRIKKFPSASPLVPYININSDHTYRYVTLKGPLQLVYSIQDNVCKILAVWNTRMSPDNLKKIIKVP